MAGNKESFRPLILIILLGVIVYSNTFGNSFLWDDQGLIVENEYIKDWHYLPRIFTTNLLQNIGENSNLYRPLQSLSYSIDYSLYKLNPAGYHLTNLLFHLFNAILIYTLLNLLQKNRKVSLIASLLFVVHPIHTQAVTYISGRADPMVAFFIFLSLYLYIKSIDLRKIGYYSGSLISFILALFSKEIALIFPLVLVLYNRCFENSRQDSRRYRLLPFFIVGGAYILLRLTILNFGKQNFFFNGATIISRILTFSKVAISYLRLLFLPFNLHPERLVYLSSSLFEKSVLASLVIIILIWIVTLKTYKHSKLIFFSVSWFFLNLLPVSNIVIINAWMAEHWLYVPSLGFFVILAVGIVKFFELKMPSSLKFLKIFIILFLVLIFTFYSFLTIKRNLDWKDELTFYQKTIRSSPYSPRMHNNLGNVYISKRLYDEAVEEFKKAIEVIPYFPVKMGPNFLAKVHNNLGSAYYYKGLYNRAVEEYKKALEIDPNLEIVKSNLQKALEQIEN
jgi:tetratricopeptide (TPR) repeat protein